MKAILKVLAALPASVGYALASVAYVLIYHVFRYRRATVKENLQYAFPEKRPDEIRSIEKGFYRHFCDLVIEVLRSTHMPAEEFVRRVRFINKECLAEATAGYTRQAIILVIHQGNWEWILHSAMQQFPINSDPVYKTLHSPFWDEFMLEARSRFGATPIPLGRVGRETLRGRKRKRLIVLVADQTGPKNGGYWTQFMNRPASFYRGPEKLAQTLELPMVFAQCRKEARGQYTVQLQKFSAPPHPEDGDLILDRFVHAAEAMIAEQPETYLWTNRRWKKTPPEGLIVASAAQSDDAQQP